MNFVILLWTSQLWAPGWVITWIFDLLKGCICSVLILVFLVHCFWMLFLFLNTYKIKWFTSEMKSLTFLQQDSLAVCLLACFEHLLCARHRAACSTCITSFCPIYRLRRREKKKPALRHMLVAGGQLGPALRPHCIISERSGGCEETGRINFSRGHVVLKPSQILKASIQWILGSSGP